jgi:hypothetical protein
MTDVNKKIMKINKLKGMGSILLFGMSCAIIALYITSDEVVKPHQWFLTSMFGIYFYAMGVDLLSKRS